MHALVSQRRRNFGHVRPRQLAHWAYKIAVAPGADEDARLRDGELDAGGVLVGVCEQIRLEAALMASSLASRRVLPELEGVPAGAGTR